MKTMKLPSGKTITVHDASRMLSASITTLNRRLGRLFDLTSDEPDAAAPWGGVDTVDESFDDLAYELDLIESQVDNLADAVEWARAQLHRRRRVLDIRRKIAKLGETTGRTPAEVNAFQAKAAEWQARLDAELEDERKRRARGW